MADGSRTFTDPESGDLVIDDGVEQQAQVSTGPHFENLAASAIPVDVVDGLSSTLTELVAHDDGGRDEWEKLLADNTALLGLGPESEPDDAEYENSDTSDNPLMLTALTRFQSKALSAILPLPDRVCHTECALDLEMFPKELTPEMEQAAQEGGQPPPQLREEVEDQANEAGSRVEKFMADYFLKRYKTYRSDMDRVLYECGLHGLGIKKIYNDHSRQNMKTRADYVPIEDLILSYDTKSMTCGRISQRIDMPTPELIRHIRNGTYRAVKGMTAGAVDDVGPLEKEEDRIHALSSDLMREGENHRLYEIYTELFLDQDPHPMGLARPYVVTVHAQSQEILSLRRNWQEGDPDEMPIERYVAYTYHPGKSAVLGIGLGHILANTTRALRTAQRRGLEAAYLQNHPSGYKMSNMKIRSDSNRIRPGEFQDVDTPVGDIRQALMLHPFNGPSPGLLQLAEKLEQNGRELGGIAAIDFSQMLKAGIAAGPALAAYDESTEFQTAVHSRLYFAHATEMNLIMDRMREVLGNTPVPFGVNSVLNPGDLQQVNLTPIMQPGQISKQRKVLEARALLEAADQAPDLIDRRKAYEDYIRSLGKNDIDMYMLPDPAETPPPEPSDPITEYQQVLAEQPVAAGMMQNHQAHIDAHSAQMRMLSYSQLPPDKGEMGMAALGAHIAEHMGMQLMAEVAASMGIPPEQIEQAAQDPQMEAQIAPMMAQQIVAIEEERRPEEGEGERIQVEQVKGQNKHRELQIQQDHARQIKDMEHRHAMELQKAKDDAAMDRAIQDDETAVEIAGMKDANSAKTRAGGIGS